MSYRVFWEIECVRRIAGQNSIQNPQSYGIYLDLRPSSPLQISALILGIPVFVKVWEES
jgi:hypothetical protein